MKQYDDEIAICGSCCTCKPCMEAEKVMENTRGNCTKGATSMADFDNDCNACVINMIGLAQAYVPFQVELNKMSPSKSLILGTTFADLSQPYVKGTGLGKCINE